MLTCRGMLHSLVWGHIQPLRTDASNTVMSAVWPSKILTSLTSQMETYPALANFPPLRRDWLAKAGTMLTVRAGSRALCSRLATVVVGVRWPLARTNIFDDFCPIGMKGLPIISVWEVQAVSHAADGMEPLSTPTLVCASVSMAAWGGECGWQGGRGRRRQIELSLSMRSCGSRKRTLGWRKM